MEKGPTGRLRLHGLYESRRAGVERVATSSGAYTDCGYCCCGPGRRGRCEGEQRRGSRSKRLLTWALSGGLQCLPYLPAALLE
jgi:hypothetical protein